MLKRHFLAEILARLIPITEIHYKQVEGGVHAERRRSFSEVSQL